VVEDVRDVLLPVINEDVFVVVPANSEVHLLVVLNDAVHKLLCLIRNVPKLQRKLHCFVVELHLDKMDSRIRAHHDLVALKCHLQCEYMPNRVEFLRVNHLHLINIIGNFDQLEPAFVLTNHQRLGVKHTNATDS